MVKVVLENKEARKYIPYVEQQLIRLEEIIKIRKMDHLNQFIRSFIYTFVERTLQFYGIKSEHLTFGVLLSSAVVWNLHTKKSYNFIYFQPQENTALNETDEQIIQLDVFFNTNDVEKLLSPMQKIDLHWSILLQEYQHQLDVVKINQLYIDRMQSPILIDQLLPKQIQQIADTYGEKEKLEMNFGYLALELNQETEKYYCDFWQSMIQQDHTGDYFIDVNAENKAKFKKYYINAIERLDEGQHRLVDYVGTCFPPRFGEQIFGSLTKFKAAFSTRKEIVRWKTVLFFTMHSTYFSKDLNILCQLYAEDLSNSEVIKQCILSRLERPTGYALAYLIEYELNHLYDQYCYNHRGAKDFNIHFNDAEFAKKFRQYLFRLQHLWCWSDMMQDDLLCFYLMVVSVEPYKEFLELKPLLSDSTQKIISILYT